MPGPASLRRRPAAAGRRTPRDRTSSSGTRPARSGGADQLGSQQQWGPPEQPIIAGGWQWEPHASSGQPGPAAAARSSAAQQWGQPAADPERAAGQQPPAAAPRSRASRSRTTGATAAPRCADPTSSQVRSPPAVTVSVSSPRAPARFPARRTCARRAPGSSGVVSSVSRRSEVPTATERSRRGSAPRPGPRPRPRRTPSGSRRRPAGVAGIARPASAPSTPASHDSCGAGRTPWCPRRSTRRCRRRPGRTSRRCPRRRCPRVRDDVVDDGRGDAGDLAGLVDDGHRDRLGASPPVVTRSPTRCPAPAATTGCRSRSTKSAGSSDGVGIISSSTPVGIGSAARCRSRSARGRAATARRPRGRDVGQQGPGRVMGGDASQPSGPDTESLLASVADRATTHFAKEYP